MLHGEAMQASGIAGAFLDGHDILAAGHFGEELVAHADTHASGVVVQHDRQVRRVVDGQDVGSDFLLSRQGVGGRTDQDGVSLDGFGCLGIGDRLFSTDGAGAYHQGQTAIDHILGLRGEIEALLSGVSVVLTRRAADDDAVDLRFDQVFQYVGEGRFIDGAFCCQGSDCRGKDAVKIHDAFSCGLKCWLFAAPPI
ncbi:hypothetical protein FQZ97_694920 [compost metagenome]